VNKGVHQTAKVCTCFCRWWALFYII